MTTKFRGQPQDNFIVILTIHKFDQGMTSNPTRLLTAKFLNGRKSFETSQPGVTVKALSDRLLGTLTKCCMTSKLGARDLIGL